MPSITSALAIAILDTITSKVDEGTGTSGLLIYGGAIPANVSEAIFAQPLLIRFDLPNVAFEDATDADPAYVEAVAAAIPNKVALLTGEASFARVVNRDNVAVWQSSVGETGGVEEVLLSSKNITKDVETTVISANARYPKDAA